jgi:hypothetical protein
MKRMWEAPKLIVLVRSKPEESLILACKGGEFGGPNELFYYCKTEGAQGCPYCSEDSTS